MTLKWEPDKFKKQLIADLVSNSDIVGQFVVSEARKKLLAITDPDWGAGHRKYVSKLVTSEVDVKPNEVEIRVGALATPKSRHFGFYIETGSKSGAAHPWLRPSVFQNAAKIVALLSGK
jgi:hypothetical protein